MKHFTILATWKALTTLLILNVIQTIVLAQDSTSSSTTIRVTKEQQTTWYTQPWIWIVGIAVFVLLLVALLGGRSKSGRTDKISVTKTIKTDTDTD